MFGFGHRTDDQVQAAPPAAAPVARVNTVSAEQPAKAHRMSIVLFSGTVDKLMAASILATGAAAMGMEVELFLTTWGVVAFRKDDYKTNTRVTSDYADYGPAMREVMQAKRVPSWMDNLLGAKEIGDVHIAACSMTMELYNLRLEDLEPVVDEITGVATFMARAQQSEVTLFI
jgi:peroxiredoxin family protein